MFIVIGIHKFGLTLYTLYIVIINSVESIKGPDAMT